MVDTQVRPNDVTDRRLIGALLTTPRESFVPKDLEPVAYAEKALETSPGRWLWAPRDLGKLLEEAEIEEGERALVIAAGSGYVAAILAAMGADVVAVEDDATLVEGLRERFAGDARISVEQDDLKSLSKLSEGFDVIVVGGSVGETPDRWLALLNEGGRLAVAIHEGAVGRARIYLKSNGIAGARSPFDCSAPALAGFDPAPEFRL